MVGNDEDVAMVRNDIIDARAGGSKVGWKCLDVISKLFLKRIKEDDRTKAG